MVFIMNFTNSRKLFDIKEQFDKYKGTNINFLLDDFAVGKTKWFVPKNAVLGDIIVFMCAKEARHNLGMATSHIPADYSDDFRSFIDVQKTLYKKYSGFILGYGIVESAPYYDNGWWMSDIDHLCQFSNPIYIDCFRSFITISRTNSITVISDDQWERLKWVVDQQNPGIFPTALPPDAEIIKKEFEDAVQKASNKSLSQLKKAAEKKSSQAMQTIIQTKVYHRDPIIAAYTKKRANGYCQLCENEAPFIDMNGEPYLECHHLDWLSKGGKDSIDNCVALCPNCHRKMHAINDPNDIKALRATLEDLNI